MKRKRLWILLWLAGILFPMAFLGRLWPGFGRIFNAAFAADWAHVAMHGFLYLVLGALLADWLKPDGARACLRLLALALAVGVLHEGIQLLSAWSWPGWGAELLDLCVDLTGASLGVALTALFRWRKPARRDDNPPVRT